MKDLYEMPREVWKDNLKLWPGVADTNMELYLVFMQSLYSGEDCKTYRRLECQQHFVTG